MKLIDTITRLSEPLLEATITRLQLEQFQAEVIAEVWWSETGRSIAEAQLAQYNLPDDMIESMRHYAHAHVLNYAVHRLTREARLRHIVVMWYISALAGEHRSIRETRIELRAHIQWHETQLIQYGFDIAMLKSAFP